jgi:hypothetical protein
MAAYGGAVANDPERILASEYEGLYNLEKRSGTQVFENTGTFTTAPTLHHRGDGEAAVWRQHSHL